MMKLYIKYLFILVISLFYGCAASEPETVSFDIPFSGALTNDTRVVTADGAVFNGTFFNLFDSAGNTVGSMRLNEAMISTPTIQMGQTLFTMPVVFQVDGDQVATNSMQFIEFPYSDPTIPVCSGAQEGVRCFRGAGSGTVDVGTGAFQFAVGRRVIEHRYVVAVTGEGANRHAVHQVHSVVLLHQ